MRARRCSAALGALVALACSGTPQPEAPALDPAVRLGEIGAARADLLRTWDSLDRVRDELQLLRDRPTLTAAEAARRRELEARRPPLEAALENALNADQAALADFLGEALRARPRSRETQRALELYAEGAIRSARDAIDRAGDYRRAIELLETAKSYFDSVHLPVPAVLERSLAHARAFRALTRPRFDRLVEGMTPSQVRALVGVPFHANVRHGEVSGKQVVSWLYGREDGGVAGLYFAGGRLYAWRWDAGVTGARS